MNLILLALLSLFIHVNAVRDSGFARSLLGLSKCNCDTSQRKTPNRLAYANTTVATSADGRVQTWLCFRLVVDKTGTVCDDPLVPAAEKTCCNSDINKIEFAVAAGCAGSVAKARLYEGDVQAGYGNVTKELSFAYVPLTSTSAVLRLQNLGLTQSAIAAYPDGLNACFSLKGGGTPPVWEICSTAQFFPDVTSVEYRVYDKSPHKCCPEGNINLFPNPTPSAGPTTPPPLPPSPSPKPNCKCDTYSAGNYPWRVSLKNVTTLTASSGQSFDQVCLHLYTDSNAGCDDKYKCCTAGLKRIELFNLNSSCVGIGAPYTLSTTTGISQSYSWDHKNGILKFPKLDLAYAVGDPGVSLCFTIQKKGTECSRYGNLCPGRVCAVGVFNPGRDSREPNDCCPGSTIGPESS